MKRTCSGCKALDAVNGGFMCTLGYEIKEQYTKDVFLTKSPKPLEECPKPKTNKEYITLRRSHI